MVVVYSYVSLPEGMGKDGIWNLSTSFGQSTMSRNCRTLFRSSRLNRVVHTRSKDRFAAKCVHVFGWMVDLNVQQWLIFFTVWHWNRTVNTEHSEHSGQLIFWKRAKKNVHIFSFWPVSCHHLLLQPLFLRGSEIYLRPWLTNFSKAGGALGPQHWCLDLWNFPQN